MNRVCLHRAKSAGWVIVFGVSHGSVMVGHVPF